MYSRISASVKTAFVFAGAHKTATTALQQACQQHVDDLLDCGLLFPCPASGYSNIPVNHTSIIRECFGAKAWGRKMAVRGYSAQPLHEVVAAWNQVLASNQNLLIVAEGICHLKSPELHELRGSFESAGYQVRPFFSIRNPDSYLRSVVQQKVKGQALALAPDRCINIGLLTQLEKLLSAWPDTQLMTFEQACESEDGPVGFYLRQLSPSLPIALVKAMGGMRSNPSGTDQAVRLASHLHALHPRGSSPQKFREQRAFILALFRRLTGDPFRLLTTDLDGTYALAQVESQTSGINQILAEKIKHFRPYKPIISYGKESAPWTPEVFQSIEELRRLCPDDWAETLSDYIVSKRL